MTRTPSPASRRGTLVDRGYSRECVNCLRRGASAHRIIKGGDGRGKPEGCDCSANRIYLCVKCARAFGRWGVKWLLEGSELMHRAAIAALAHYEDRRRGTAWCVSIAGSWR